jgi:perosamine synthetase
MIPQFEPMILPEYIDAVTDVMKSGWVGPGKSVTRFEDMVAEYTGAEYAIATSSGTTALLTCLIVLKINSIALPNYSFIAAMNVAGFTHTKEIQIVDIDYKTLCMNYDLLKSRIDNTDVVLFINHNGYVGTELEKIRDLCSEKQKLLIEDAACALGQVYNSKHAGTFGDIGCFSFSVPKIITTGQGGMIVTTGKDFAKRCREVIDQGSTTWRQDGYHQSIGLNFKMSDIAASYGIAQMKNIDKLLKIRHDNQKVLLDIGLNLVIYKTDNPTGTWMNILVCPDAKQIQSYLHKKGISSKLYYRSIVDATTGKDNSSIGDLAYRTCLYLPSSLTLTKKDLEYIGKVVNET